MIKIWPFFCKTVKKKLFLPESEVVDSIIMSLSVFSPPVSISSLLGMADEQFKPRPQQFDEFFSLFLDIFCLFSSFFNADFSFLNSSGENVVENFRQIAKFSICKSFPAKFFVKMPIYGGF